MKRKMKLESEVLSGNQFSIDCITLNVVSCDRNWSKYHHYTGMLELPEPNLWCLTLVLLPAACIFGNFLVVLAVLSEKSLKTTTNYLLVSLAFADLLVGTLVMPFSVYLTINRLNWFLPDAVCNFFCVADVSASTASIVHLVAISIDRFYAVVRHMEYKSPRHKRRIYCTILFSWIFSIGIGLPLGIGMNRADIVKSKDPYQCGIVNPDYMLYVSIFAFFIPCLVMVIMYGVVFYRLHRRMKAVRLQEMAAGEMVRFGDNLGNIFQSAYGTQAKLRRASMMWAMPFLKTIEATIVENEDEMSSEELDELTTILHTLESQPKMVKRNVADIPETVREGDEGEGQAMWREGGGRLSDWENTTRRRLKSDGSGHSGGRSSVEGENGNFVPNSGHRRRRASFNKAKQKIKTLKDRAIELLMKLKSKQGMVIRKETRATKLVATVMLLFLLCYMPFFTLNIVKVFMLRTNTWNLDLEGLFIFFTWLGYFNSCLNPLIYSLYNRKFRAAFQKLLRCPAEDTENSKQKRFSKAIGDSDERKSWIASQKYTSSPAMLSIHRRHMIYSKLSPGRNGVPSSGRCKSNPAFEVKQLPILAVQSPSTVGPPSEVESVQQPSSVFISKSTSLGSMTRLTKLSNSLNSRSSSQSTRSIRLLSDNSRDEEEEELCEEEAGSTGPDFELAMLRKAQLTGYQLLSDQSLDLTDPVRV